MHQGSGMNQLNDRGTSIGTLIDGPFSGEFGHQEDEHRAHLLAFAIDNVVCDTVEQGHLGGHGISEFVLEGSHLCRYRFFDLFGNLSQGNLLGLGYSHSRRRLSPSMVLISVMSWDISITPL